MHIVTSHQHDSKNHEKSEYFVQETADIIFLSSADTEISLLSKSINELDTYPSIRLANLLNLSETKSIDNYINKTLSKAKIVIVRILGGKSYWNYGIEKLIEHQMTKKCDVIFFPGDDKFDEQLYALSSIKGMKYKELWSYFIEGGAENASNLLKYISYLQFNSPKPASSKKISPVGIYWPKKNEISSVELEKNWNKSRKHVIAITFYSALLQSGQTEVIDSLIFELQKNYNCLPIYAKSFKDKKNAELTTYLLQEYSPISLINLTGFSLKEERLSNTTIFDSGERLVFQGVLSSMSEHEWSHSSKGMNDRDIIMAISLPEIDGRIITKTIAFKEKIKFDSITQTDLVEYHPNIFGIKYLCNLVKKWGDLINLSNNQKKIFISLANYPNKDSRIANGVGLDTPNSIINFVNRLKKEDYQIEEFPNNADKLMKQLIAGQTNNLNKNVTIDIQSLSLKDYKKFYKKLSKKVRNEVEARWGRIEDDPFVEHDILKLPIQIFGNIAIGIQPARGYNIDPKNTYHSPDLVPPHFYFGYYFWLKYIFRTNAIIQFGKHGNLEWLPGKSLSLSENCYPEAILQSTPLIYPFIVNDPGEGTQAKRRNAALIVDHLTPSLTNADTYGELIEIEILLDEYYEAYQTDQNRAKNIRDQIIELTQSNGLYADTMIEIEDDTETKLNKIDTYLCEIKELQIRDGLHIFGKSPKGNELNNLLLSIAKISRNNGLSENQPITQAIADDINLNFNSINCIKSAPYSGSKKNCLAQLSKSMWRTNSDTIERLELLSEKILKNDYEIPSNWKNTISVINSMNMDIKIRIKESGKNELNNILNLLESKFIKPGPSGAPTRGKVEVLPTGKNFYSIDMRALPTRTAWSIGALSADLLIKDFYKRKGYFPTHFGLSAWGTSNMRTGGDDISQALALIGAKPKWDNVSGRVNGFEIIPIGKLSRPRVDVTLRISGFFRDAFPNLINLFDQAVQEIIKLDESANDNPIRAAHRKDIEYFKDKKFSDTEVHRLASYRVFSSMPGSYGAGLQSLIDEGIWKTSDDLADNYINWGSYAYGIDNYGDQNKKIFTMKLERLEAVIQNQDNREHDMLDSDDYYQFHGGMGSAVKKLSGRKPIYYHNDHSKPQDIKIRTLDEELSKIVRGRAVNPKWINSIMKHGYKGAFELLATLDYLYAYQATTGLVKDHHFDLLFESYIIDERVNNFIQKYNPDALSDMKKRFLDAIERKLWHPKRNDTLNFLKIEK